MNSIDSYDVELMYYINDLVINQFSKHTTRINTIEINTYNLMRFALECKLFTSTNIDNLLGYCLIIDNNISALIDYGLINANSVCSDDSCPIIFRAALNNWRNFHDLVLAGANIWCTYNGKSVAHYVEHNRQLMINYQLVESGLVIPPCKIGKFYYIADQLAMLYKFI
jgi:hypothetical protein